MIIAWHSLIAGAAVLAAIYFWVGHSTLRLTGAYYIPSKVACTTFVNETVQLSMPLHNIGQVPVRIVGLRTSCGAVCCLRERQICGIVIHPGTTKELWFDIVSFQQGPFSQWVTLYVDAGTLEESIVNIVGFSQEH